MNHNGLFLKALIRLLILFNAFLFLPFLLTAQSLPPRHVKALELTLSLRLSEASQIINELKKENPDDPFLFYIQDYQDFLYAFITEEEKATNRFENEFSGRIKRLERTSSSPLNRYFAANMFLRHALLRLRNGDYISAASALSSASRRIDPGFLPSRSALGVLNIITGAVPDQYRNLLAVIGFEGDVDHGLTLLRQVIRTKDEDQFSEICSLEALFYLAIAESAYGRDKEAGYRILKESIGENKNSGPLFIFAKAQVCMQAGKNDEALEILAAYVPAKDELPFHYLDYLNGRLRLNRLDPEADNFLKKYVSSFRGNSYIASALERLAWSSLLRGDLNEYEKFRKMTVSAKTATASDKQAVKEMASPDPVSVPLLKARLLYDGGYYEKALKVLLGTSLSQMVSSKKDLTEYNYRMGRIWQGMGNTDKAILYFDHAIRTGSSGPWYFAANAALQKGLILEKQGRKEEAEKSFRQCLEMKCDEYKTALDQKARAGIKRTRKNG